MNDYKIVIDAGHGRYYYTKTNKIDVKALNNTLNDSENIVFFICQVMPFFAFFSILPH